MPLLFHFASSPDLPGDDIEAGPVNSAPVLSEPGCRTHSQPGSLVGIHRELGRAEAQAAAGFDFDEYRGAPAAKNQVEFNAARTDVARNDAVPF